MSDTPPTAPRPPRVRGIYCNRTLNLRSIRAIGYDMDYTLIHYRVEEWEERAYTYLQQKLIDLGWPAQSLSFDPTFIVRGLIIDVELGNIVKANRFGYVKRAYHGTQPLGFDTQRHVYAQTVVDLDERQRYKFLNTLFSLSEACMYAQLVDLLDARVLPEVMGYADLYARVRQLIDEAHVEGMLKAEIVADPDRFVELDPETPLALLDQHMAGKKLLLITNSEWPYTTAMMRYAFDRFLPGNMTWRELFDVVIVSARKPAFFSGTSPVFEVLNAEGHLQPALELKAGAAFVGGDARLVERHLGVAPDQILFVGDHLFADVHVTKNLVRWRTALVLRELEADLQADEAFVEQRFQLQELMARKAGLEFASAQARLRLQRIRQGYAAAEGNQAHIERELARLRERLASLDEEISPLAHAASQVSNPRWGMLMRAGNDKSHLARQVERYADIYLSRVSNFLFHTPFLYLRAPRGTLPHDVDAATADDR